MITKEEVTLNFLQYALKTWTGPSLPKHYILAHHVLRSIVGELRDQKRFAELDSTWPFHIVILTKKGAYCSVFCSGYSKEMELHMLTKAGKPDSRFYGHLLMTPRGAVNFIEKRYGIGN